MSFLDGVARTIDGFANDYTDTTLLGTLAGCCYLDANGNLWHISGCTGHAA